MNTLMIRGMRYRTTDDDSFLVIHVAMRIFERASFSAANVIGATLIGLNTKKDRVEPLFENRDCNVPYCAELGPIRNEQWAMNRHEHWFSQLEHKRICVTTDPIPEVYKGTEEGMALSMREFSIERERGMIPFNFEARDFNSISDLMSSKNMSDLMRVTRLTRTAMTDFLLKPISQMMMGHYTATDDFTVKDASIWGSTPDASVSSTLEAFRDYKIEKRARETEMAYARMSKATSSMGRSMERMTKAMLEGEWTHEYTTTGEPFFKGAMIKSSEQQLDDELGELLNESKLMNEESWGMF